MPPSPTRTVWKYELKPGATFIDMPQGAELVHVGVQGARPMEVACVWAVCDPDQPTVKRQVGTVPTGSIVTGEATYVGTFHIESGLVFHVFDGGERA